MEAVTAHALHRRFGAVPALSGVDLSVPAGSVHGLLGPNGAGKTTLVRILTTLLRPTAGTATVAGFDVLREPDRVRASIGLVGQHAAVDEILSGRQNLEMFGRLHHLGRSEARTRAVALLERFGLADTGSRAVSTYSGGMRRRLDLAASLITAPPVLFLDEPTTGLDPRSRSEVWEAVRSLVAGGTTVLLTTQYLEEVDRLADHVTVIDHGTVIASGTPSQLKGQLGGDRIDVVVSSPADLAATAALLAGLTGNTPDTDEDNRRVGVAVDDRMAALTATVRGLSDAGIAVEDVTLRRPTLDEVFLHLTATDDARMVTA
ncbi:ATP-binding cassette domain-containing protein [Asanoa siamensis]|uniref:Daunorubicin resistance protein DrrA family ABC transporter ATP-binding protein n=1 Tax=Asanoa siamensis TaxID=926357 RepID=A0ABQ4D407_9ACTN|nr:ATP-binding cassette domain-containing protein [Asanoa siamensis]GIF78235.1 daunorubicin resistance protein DrrA family ABC transporter ATP-binding protein [Asanoa siamensis]